MTQLKQDELSPDVLLIDPNNYRFQDIEGFVYAAEDRFHEESVQHRATQRLREEPGLLDLKKSILRNGFIPLERLVVRPYKYATKTSKWVVIEGNRRVAAVRWILDDHDAGAEVSASVLESIKKLPVVITEEDGPDQKIFRASLMGIRHVSGIAEWGGYQRAKLIAGMRDNLKLEPGNIAERLGLSTHEVNRRYRAFKALEQMQHDEEYGPYAQPHLYPLFHEAVSLPVVREWLDWNDDQNQFKNEDNLATFYGLLSPTTDDDDSEKDAKLKTYLQVRELRSILPKTEAKRLLLDPARSFQDALAVARQEELSHLWATDVSAAISALENMGVHELKSLTSEEIELLSKVMNLAKERLQDHENLSKHD